MSNSSDFINSLNAKFSKLDLSNSENYDELFVEFEKCLRRKDDEQQILLEKFNNLNVIINFIPNTISWINKDLTYFGANKALANTCNLNPEDFVGRPIGFHTKERFFFEFATDLFRSSQETLYRELEAKISGVEHTFLVSGTKINNSEQAVVIGIDITEIKNLKGHVSLTEKLATLGEMFAGIIHDINNPLMMIDASAKKIKKLTSDEEVLEILGKIQMSTSKVSKIIDGIKIFVRQDEETPFQSENLGSIIDDSIVICENKLKMQSVRLSYDNRFKSINVNCNFTQIFQVFVNLISNSIDAMSTLEDKWIEISIDDSDNSDLVILFTDSGNGISLELQAKIFQAFYTTKGRGVGSGLGLSLVKKILEAHKGNIIILNNRPNTTFEIRLPKLLDK